jgi:ribosome-binding ATPase YchF (GTP1/OBG family)
LGFDLSAAAIDPVSDLQVIDNEKLKSIAGHGSEKLEKMIKKASE